MNMEEYFLINKQKLYILLTNAIKNVDFYSKIYKFVLPNYENFSYEFFKENIPILEKKFVRENSEKFINKDIDKNMLVSDMTSGTEGKPIICYMTKKNKIKCSGLLWKLRRKFVKDLNPSSKFARFYAFRNNENKIISNKLLYKNNDILLPLFDLSEDKLKYYWRELLKFSPRWIHGPSSTIYNLALVIHKYKLDMTKIDLIELTGEFVSDIQYKFITDTFKCKVVNQYGCREYWPMAFTNENDELQVLKEQVFIEEMPSEEDNQNEFLVTFLSNNEWPLIRYRIGDLGNIKFNKDEVCLQLLNTRKADFFTMKNNKSFNAIIFSGIARAICELHKNNVILQFQAIKMSEELINIKIKLKDDCDKNQIINQYKNELIDILGKDIKINIQEVHYIPPDNKSGKTKDFIDISH